MKRLMFFSFLLLLQMTCMAQDVTDESQTTGKTLNDIRFAGWTEDDWFDNEYYRTLRTYLNDWFDGKTDVIQEYDKYKEDIRGSKFLIAEAEPSLYGGLFVVAVFLDAPHLLLQTHIYSYVDEEKETVTGYSINAIIIEELEKPFTKELLMEYLDSNPKNKLW